jgi:cell division protein FtsQ
VSVVGIFFFGIVRVSSSWVNSVPFLSISRIIISGETRYTTLDDIKSIYPFISRPCSFFSQEIISIQKFFQELPWIQYVSVQKKWPDTVVIKLKENKPVASWNESWMIDKRGTLFKIPKNFTEATVPMLFGPEGNDKELLLTYKKIQTLLRHRPYQLRKLWMTNRYSWHLTMSDDILIKLGSQNPIGRLDRFISSYPALKAKSKEFSKSINYVDLRYDSGVAVGWQ